MIHSTWAQADGPTVPVSMGRICLRAANGEFGRFRAIWGVLDVLERAQELRKGAKVYRSVDLFDDPREVGKQGVKAAKFGQIRRKLRVGKRES